MEKKPPMSKKLMLSKLTHLQNKLARIQARFPDDKPPTQFFT